MRNGPKSTPKAPAAAPQPAAQPQEPTITLPPLRVSQVQVLLDGLGQLPLARALEMFGLIQSEAQRQLPQPGAPA